MPELPLFTAPLVPNPPEIPRVNIGTGGEAFGALAQGADRFADVAGQFAEQRAMAVRAADAANITAQATQHFDDMQHRWSLALNPALADKNNPNGLPDREYSQQGFAAEAKQYSDQLLSGIQDPLIQQHVAGSVAGEIAGRTADTANMAFQREGQARVGQLDQNLFQQAQSAAGASNPELRQKIAADAHASISNAVGLGWMRADEGAQRQINFNSTLSRIDAQKYIRDADMAMDQGKLTPLEVSSYIADPTHFPGLPAEMRQTLADQAIREGRTIVAIQTGAQAEADRQADKTQKAGQQTREVSILADIDAGHGPDAATLEHLGQTQQISLAGYQAARAALAKQTKPTDDLPTYDSLNRRLMAGEDVGADVLQAQADGQLTTKTGQALLKANTAKLTGGESAIDKANFATLKTALGGAAIENGFAFDKPETQARNVAVWTEAQKEWTTRVLGNRENSNQVLADMLPRLQPMRSQLPPPQLGPIKSAADLTNVARATVAAHQAGQMTDAQYLDQVRVLNLWREYTALTGDAGAAPGPLKPNTEKGQ